MVNTREIAAEYRLTHWAQILQDRADSGLTVKAYCTQQGICRKCRRGEQGECHSQPQDNA
ncbi:MAG: hypothetical protein RR336_01170 [Oscillospiraceae bacterium]